jgi:ABC-type tungstate transport system substrate-binding protein
MTIERTKIDVPDESKARLSQERAEYKEKQLKAARVLVVETRRYMAEAQSAMPGFRGELGRAMMVGGELKLDTSLIQSLENVFEDW